MSELLSQNDPQWSGDLLGDGPLLIGPYGCYLTCFTMVANHGGANVDVPTMNQVLKENSRFVESDLLTDQSLDGLFGAQYVETLWYTNGPADLNVMKDTYEDEYIIELFINGNPNFTHFVRWVSGHSKATLQIANPWDGRIEYFQDVYGDPVVNIQKMVHYRVPNPTIPHIPVEPAIPEPTPVIEAPQVAPEPNGQPSGEIPVTVVQPLPEFQATYVEEPCEKELKEDSAALDMSGQNAPKSFVTGTQVKLAGYFTENGRKYWRGATSAEQGLWYGIPDDSLVASDNPTSEIVRAEQEASKLALEALHASAVFNVGKGLVNFLVKFFQKRFH